MARPTTRRGWSVVPCAPLLIPAAAFLIASAALAQPAGPIPPEVAPADGAPVLTVPSMTACLDALRRTGARTAVADGVSCAIGTTTHPEQVGYCLFRPVGSSSLPMLELFREPATHPGRADAGVGPFVYDAGIAVTSPDLPATRLLHFFDRGRAVATLRLSLTPLSSMFEPPPHEAPAPVRALLRDGDAVREACFGLDLAS